MDVEDAQGQGLGRDEAQGIWPIINAHGQELRARDAQVRGLSIGGDAQVRERSTSGDAQVRERSTSGDAQVRERSIGDAQVRGHSIGGDAQVRERSIGGDAQVRERSSGNYAQVRERSSGSHAQVREHSGDDAYAREQSKDEAPRRRQHRQRRARERGHGLFGFGDDQGSRKKRRLQSEESDDSHHGRTRTKRRYSSRLRQTKRKRRYYSCSSTESPSSSESDEVHPNPKRTKISRDNSILDKVLTVMKSVRSSDRSKMTYNNVIPEFDPMKKEQTILTWLTKVEECTEIYGWDEKETIHYSLQKLCGVAKTWYQGLPTLLHSWSEWKKKLIAAFPCREDFSELLTEMLSKRVKYGESLEEYFYAKVNLLNRCQIKGRQAVDCLLNGVDDRAVRVGAQAAQFPEPEQVLKYFRSVKVGNTRENDTMKRISNRFDRNTAAITNKPSYSKTGPSNSNIRCYNCDQIGHPSFRCDKPATKCSNCDKLGHLSTHCFNNRANNN